MTILLDVYKSILLFAGIQVDSEDMAVNCWMGKKDPFTYMGKRVVLPTQTHLDAPEGKLVFHPLREDIAAGESAAICALRDVLMIKFNAVVATLCNTMLMIAAGADGEPNVDPGRMDIISGIGEVPLSTVKKFEKIIKAASKDQLKRKYVKFYMKRGGTVSGTRYSRTYIVTFPFYEELVNNTDDKVFDVTISQKERDIFLRMMKFLFPQIDEQDGYSAGSHSKTAPILDALMKASLNVVQPLNDMLEICEAPEDQQELKFYTGWQKYFEDLESLTKDIMRIPSQEGNRVLREAREERAKEEPRETPPPEASRTPPKLGWDDPRPTHQNEPVRSSEPPSANDFFSKLAAMKGNRNYGTPQRNGMGRGAPWGSGSEPSPWSRGVGGPDIYNPSF